MTVLRDIPITFSEEEKQKIIANRDPQIIRPLFDMVSQALDPRIIHTKAQHTVYDGKQVALTPAISIESTRLAEQVASCQEILVTAMTIGESADELIQKEMKDDLFKGFFLDFICSQAVRKLGEWFLAEIRREYAALGLDTTCLIFPGCETFPLEEQAKIFAFLKPEAIGLELSKSYLMKPFKSITAVVGVGWDIPSGARTNKCEDCSCKNCSHRSLRLQ